MKDDRHSPFRDAYTDRKAAEGVPDTPQTRSPSYPLAFADDEFMCRDELRPVRLQLELLKPEMLMDVTFLSPTEDDTAADSGQPAVMRLYIPSQLVQQSDGGPFVWVADQAASVARRVEVELGAQGQRGQVEVTRGLNRTSRLIASGSESLRDGSRIRVTGEAPDLTPSPSAP